MAGTKRKRQKTEKTGPVVIGSKDFDEVNAASAALEADKDDEEIELESFLFGTSSSASKPQQSSKGKARLNADDAPPAAAAQGPTGLDHVLDEDLFVLDEALPNASDAPTTIPLINEESDNESSTSSSPPASPKSSSTPFPLQSTKKKAAWLDPSDAHLSVSLAADTRLRKLRDAPGEDQIGGKQYESKLRRKFEQMNPTPEWAQSAREKVKKQKGRKRPRDSSATEDEDEPMEEGGGADLDDLLRDTGGVLASKSSRGKALMQGTLDIERLRDANNSAVSEGSVTSAKFHPSPSVPVMMTVGMDRRLRLFTVDGLTNPLLQTLHIPDLPSPSSSSTFHPSGTSILLTSTSRPYFYAYDLQAARAVESTRGLWHGAPGGEDGQGRSMDVAKFDETDGGRLLAVAGRRGYVHLVDWVTGGGNGGGQVVGSLKAHSPIKDLAWIPTSVNGGAGGSRLMTLTQDAEVYIWDVGTRRCISRWKDEGNFGASVLALSRSGAGASLAVGSSTGIVNLYDSSASSPSTSPTFSVGRETRSPLKVITNLTTAITDAVFDRSSQIMAIASRAKKDQLRLVHTGSMTTFSNWPTSGTPLGTVTSVDFSPGSEYLAIGNTRGKVTLWNLKHFISS
ncbi:WD40 repeat-like protein [Clavulina sp. PMI_390]|nr:WD40 repeat-like protein [Clavulina sp. PMI_390]